MKRSASSAEVGGIRWQGNRLILRVQVQPRARRNEFAGLHGEALKIRLTAPPVDGLANAALVAFLAEAFGVPRHQVDLLHGQTGRQKLLSITAPSRIPDALSPTVRPVATGNIN
jgi:uncharacterized protein (TIGR00251 family)